MRYIIRSVYVFVLITGICFAVIGCSITPTEVRFFERGPEEVNSSIKYDDTICTITKKSTTPFFMENRLQNTINIQKIKDNDGRTTETLTITSQYNPFSSNTTSMLSGFASAAIGAVSAYITAYFSK